ncbi:MAG: hypothetical protein M1830_000754, partial [Pleopsidium flavum]
MGLGSQDQVGIVTSGAESPAPVVKKQRSHPALSLSTAAMEVVRSKSSSSSRKLHTSPAPSLPTAFSSKSPPTTGLPSSSSRIYQVCRSNSSRPIHIQGDEYADTRISPSAQIIHRQPLQENMKVDSRKQDCDGRWYPPSPNSIHGPEGLLKHNSMKPRHGSSTRSHQTQKLKLLHHSPTFPILPDRKYGELQMPLAFSALTRERGASISSHSPRRRQNPAIPLRPSASIPDYDSSGIVMCRQRNPLRANHPMPTAQDCDRSTNGTATVPPKDKDDSKEIRASFRSAVTSGSSLIDASGTERSSVVTKSSSMSDLTNEAPETHRAKDEGMSVDDAIGMYAAGFGDDDDLETGKLEMQLRRVDAELRRSREMAQAMNDNMGEDGCGSVPPEVMLRISTAVDSKDGSSTDLPMELPTIMTTTAIRDRYGFRKATQHVTLDQYDTWNREYTKRLERRGTKWLALMKEHRLPVDKPTRFPAKSAKVKRFVRKGIPPEWRGAAWFWYAGGFTCLHRHPGLYQGLVEKSKRGEMNENDAELIERDLHRTFPDNLIFKPDSTPSDDHPKESKDSHEYQSTEPETPILKSLRRLLRAFSIHDPRIGYCQSLNFLAGLLLLFMPEEKAFWMLVIITTTYLPGTHEISLEGANVDLWVLMTSIKESMPIIWNKVAGDLDGTAAGDRRTVNRLPPITLCTTAWFMSCFIGTLPIETVLRVWDTFFYEGSKTLFRIALAIFKIGEHEIKAVNDPMEIFQVVQTIPRRLIDASQLMDVCFRKRNGFGHLRQETVEERRRERR